jgi:hypothetical protein
MLLGPMDIPAEIEFEGGMVTEQLRLVWKRTKERLWPNNAP